MAKSRIAASRGTPRPVPSAAAPPALSAQTVEPLEPAPANAWHGHDAQISRYERDVKQARMAETVRAALVKALKAYKRRDFGVTALQALSAAEIDPACAQAWHVLALGLENLGQLSKALVMYERALTLDPKDPEIYLNLGLVAWRLHMLEGAEKFFRINIQLDPKSPMGPNNLGGVLRDLGRYEEAIEVLRGAIYVIPDVPELWNTLGTVVMEQGAIQDAIVFYNEALRLNPKLARVHHNIAHTLAHTGPLDTALHHYERALKLTSNPADSLEMRHGRALCLLAVGRLEEGWREWEVRHDPAHRGSMLYAIDAPRWKGEPLAGKRLVVMGEQGLGDELMFATGYREIVEQIGPAGKLVITCDNRLAPLFTRSFPGAEVRLYNNSRHNGKGVRSLPWAAGEERFDYFSPNGSTLPFLRAHIDRFPTREPMLIPDPARVAYWRAKLEALGPGPYVGVCWRSMVMTGARAKYYSPLEGWAPVLQNRNVTFVNLQYGDSAADRAFAKEHFGADIHNFDELDLKNALDDNAALCKALDLVLSAPTAAGALAGCVGTKVWLLTISYVWPMLGTPDRFPWFTDSRVMMPRAYADWPSLMATVGAELQAFARSKS